MPAGTLAISSLEQRTTRHAGAWSGALEHVILTKMPSASRPLRVVFNYALAVVAAGAAVLLRFALRNVPEFDSPFPLFLAAVTIAAAIGGLGPGLLATLLSILAGNYFFTDPSLAFDFSTSARQLHAVIFAVEGAFISILCNLLHDARRRAEEQERALLRDAELRRRLEQQILETADRERERIGHDLHDELGQLLTGASMAARALSQSLDAEKSPHAPDVRRLADHVQDAVGWTRQLARGLSPIGPPMQDGLQSALSELASHASDRLNVRCALAASTEALEPADSRVTMHLFRIAQEAITNAVRHGRATVIELRLSPSPQGTTRLATLTIQDNGCGFAMDSPEALPRAGTMGLQLMRYRARLIGATLRIDARPGAGATITCTFPVGSAAAAAASAFPSAPASVS